MNDKKEILFVCIGNACRSPMAEGFAKKYGEGKVEAFSAGVFPLHSVSEGAVEVMKEIGVDISDHVPRHVEALVNDGKYFDCAVILDRSIELPFLPADEVLTHHVPDPFNKTINEYRETREMVRKIVISVLKKLGVPL